MRHAQFALPAQPCMLGAENFFSKLQSVGHAFQRFHRYRLHDHARGTPKSGKPDHCVHLAIRSLCIKQGFYTLGGRCVRNRSLNHGVINNRRGTNGLSLDWRHGATHEVRASLWNLFKHCINSHSCQLNELREALQAFKAVLPAQLRGMATLQRRDYERRNDREHSSRSLSNPDPISTVKRFHVGLLSEIFWRGILA